MTIFDASNADEIFFPTGTTSPADAIDFASQVTATATTYSWLTSTGHLVTATGTFTYPGGNVAGTVTSLAIDLSNDADSDIAITAVANVDIALLLASNASFWSTLFSGNDSFIAAVSADAKLNGDFHDDASGTAGNDTFTLAFAGGGGSFYGDWWNNAVGAPVTGGDDVFNISGALGIPTNLIGDAGTASATDIFVGGNDEFTVNTTGFAFAISADVGGLFGQLLGGSDTITVTAGDVTISGDADAIHDGATLEGGDDTVTGAYVVYGDVTSFLGGTAYCGFDTLSGTYKVFGDVNSISGAPGAGSVLACGDDTVSASDAGAMLYGDIGDVGINISTVTLTFGDDILTGGTDGDTIYGDYGLDTLGQMGSAGGNDVIFAGGGADTIHGNGGDDIIDPGTGDDTVVDGGEGRDTISYASLAAAVTVDLTLQGVAQNTIGGGTDTLTNFENIMGGSGGDTLTGDGADNVITGGLGNDVLTGGTNLAEGDTASYAGNVAVTVSLALQGGQQDTLGAGLDTLNGFENLSGSDQGDTLTGNGSANTLSGGGGGDILSGAGGADTIHGGEGADDITGGAGADVMSGDAGNDTFHQINDASANIIDGGADTDTLDLSGSTIGWVVSGSSGSAGAATLTLTSIENLIGSAYSDQFIGSSVVNVFDGGGNKDWLSGGGGLDVLTGGGGADWFAFNIQHINAGATITDFSAGTDILYFGGASTAPVFSTNGADAVVNGVIVTGGAAGNLAVATQSAVFLPATSDSALLAALMTAGLPGLDEAAGAYSIHTFDADANEAFNTMTDAYTAAGLLDSNWIWYDAGNPVYATHTDLDQGNTNAWSYMVTNYSAANVVDNRWTYNDAGNAVHSTYVDYDQASANAWTTLTNYYSAPNVLDYRWTINDVGQFHQSLFTDWDQAGANTWDSRVNYYTAPGVLDVQWTYNDVGQFHAQLFTDWDQANANTWSYRINYYTTPGVLDYQWTYNDAGNPIHSINTDWDQTSVATWSYRQTYYSALNVADYQWTFNDAGNPIHSTMYDWDQGNTAIWTNRTTYYSAANVADYQWTFYDAGQTYHSQYVDWDQANVETWAYHVINFSAPGVVANDYYV